MIDRTKDGWAVRLNEQSEAKFVLVKETVLSGHYASGDCECFCFDTRSSKEIDEKHARLRERSKVIGADAAYEEFFVVEDAARVYPDDLLPKHGKRRGVWRIRVEFEPDETAPLLNEDGPPISEFGAPGDKEKA